jgi:lambda family phage tail tape measure protein
MVSETLELIIRTSGGASASQQLDNIGRSASTASRSISGMADTLRLMRNALVAISFFKMFSEISSGLSTMQEMKNLLSTVTDTGTQSSLMFQKLGRAANEVRAPMDAFTKVFTNLVRSTAGYKLTTDDAIKATQTLFATFAISGLDDNSIRNVSRDMKEVYNSGVVQGRIFRSIVMQDQEEALLLSKYIVATGNNAAAANKQLDAMRAKGQQPDIRGMITNGQQFKSAFTGGDLVTAQLKAFPEEMERMSKTAYTFSQAGVVAHNNWMMFLEYLDSKTGVFAVIAHWFAEVSNYIPEIALLVSALAGLLIINFVAKAFLDFGRMVGGVFSFIMSPILRFVGAMTSMITLPFRVGSAITGGLTSAISGLFSVVHSVMSESSTLFSTLGSGAMKIAGAIGNVVVGLVGMIAIALPVATLLVAAWMTVKQVISDLTPTFNGLIAKAKQLGLTAQDIPLLMETGFTDVFNHFSDYEKIFSALWTYVAQVFQDKMADAFQWIITNAIPGLAAAAFQAVKGAEAAIWNTGIDLGNWIRGAFGAGAGTFGHISAGGAGANAEGQSLAQLQSLLGTVGSRIIQDTATQKRAIAGASTSAHPGAPGSDSTTKDMTKKLEDARKALDALLGDYGGEWQKYLTNWDATNIKISEFEKTLGRAYVQQKILNAGLGGNNLQLAELNKAFGIKGSEEATRNVTDAQKAYNLAVELGSKDLAQYADKITQAKIAELQLQHTIGAGVQVAGLQYNQKLANPEPEAESIVNGALKQREALDNLAIGYQALTQAVNMNIVSQKAADAELRNLQLEFLKTQTDAGSGFVEGMLEAQKSLNDLATTASQTVVKAFDGLTDAITKFITTGKVNIKQFVSEIQTDLVHMIVQQNITGPLANLLGFGAGQASGSSPLTAVMGTIFGGAPAGLPGLSGGQLGSSSANPMWVQMAGGGIPGLRGGEDLGLGGPGGSAGGPSSGNGIAAALGGGPGVGGYGSPGGGFAGGGGGIFGSGGGGGITGLFSQGGLFGSGGFVSNMFNGGGGAGTLSNWLLNELGPDVTSAATSAMSAVSTGAGAAASGIGSLLASFANGGEFMVGGQGGVDSQLVAFRASPDETVSIKRPGQQSQPLNGKQELHLHIEGVKDFDSFQRSGSQMASGMASLAGRAKARNGDRA